MRALIISGFLLANIAAFGQSSFGDIIGTLIDAKTNETIPFALVVTTYGESVYKTQTEDDGRFRISAVPAGNYYLYYVVEGDTMFATEKVNVSPDGLGDAGKVMYLNQATNLDGIVLTYDREQIHLKKGVAPEIKISGDDLRASPLKFDTKTLLTSMTTDVRKSDDGLLIFRGARAGDMICYIDGIKMNDVPKMPSAAFAYMIVYSGAVPAKYGDTNGGVVVIETLSYTDLYMEWKAKMELAEQK